MVHLPVQGIDNHIITPAYPPLLLNQVLYVPNLIKNLLSVRCLTTDNNVSIEFDPNGFLVKDLQNRMPLLRCNNP